MRKKLRHLFTIPKNRKRGIHFKKRDVQLHIAEWIYPSIGLKAWWKYLILSLKRKPFSSHNIALGFAFGAFTSFTPYMGLHSLIAAIFAKLFKASITTAIIGTAVGNPWTFPIIWAWTNRLGHFILHDKVLPNEPLDLTGFSFTHLFENFDSYWHNLIWPMTIGGICTGLLFALVCYFALKYQIDKYRQVRAALINKRKQERRAKRIQDLKNKVLHK